MPLDEDLKDDSHDTKYLSFPMCDKKQAQLEIWSKGVMATPVRHAKDICVVASEIVEDSCSGMKEFHCQHYRNLLGADEQDYS